jgi:hypothetical protein
MNNAIETIELTDTSTICLDATTVQSHFPDAKYIANSDYVSDYWYVFDTNKLQIGCYFANYSNPNKLNRQKIQRVWSEEYLDQINLRQI